MKSVAKEIITRLVGYGKDEVFEVEKLAKLEDGSWSILVRVPEEHEETKSNLEGEE